MASRVSTPLKGVAATALAVGFVAAGIAPATSAPTPRVSTAQCSNVANTSGGTGYVIVDTTNNTTCVVKTNGTWVWSDGAVVPRNKPVKFKGSLMPNTRGDMVGKVKARFIRGKKVYVKWIKLRPNRTFATNYKFKKKGNWTAVFSYKGKSVTTKVKVK